jgi:hypothetical protein
MIVFSKFINIKIMKRKKERKKLVRDKLLNPLQRIIVDGTKVIKNLFLTRHKIYNINSNRKIVSKMF